MPWVNIFENEAVEAATGNIDGSGGEDPIVIAQGQADQQDLFELSTEGGPVLLYSYELLDGIRGVRRFNQGGWGDQEYIYSLLHPAGGLVGRLFRCRIHEGFVEQDGVASIAMAPTYADLGAGTWVIQDPPLMIGFPFPGDGNPQPTTEWYEFPAIPAETGLPPLEWQYLLAGTDLDHHGGFYEWQVWVEEPPACTEIGRATKANVSAHTRIRVQSVKLFPSEKRCLIANFNGAMSPARTIVSAFWRAEGVWSVSMADGAIIGNGREAKVMLSAHDYGTTTIQCTVTLDNGEIYNQLFVAEVGWTPFVPTQLPVGSATVTVTA